VGGKDLVVSSPNELLRPLLFPVHRAGWPFIFAFAVVSFLLGLLWSPLYFVGGVLTVWCVFFFRDPDRRTPTRPGLVISPADGMVQMVVEAAPPPELDMGAEPLPRISVFMNVFNCHVNRSPVDGKVVKLAYRPGTFVNASFDKASEDNERQAVRIRTPDGRDVACVQIAGLVARRILCDLRPDQEILAGQRIGMIRFGSRVDIYLPKGVTPLALPGQMTVAGETVIADLTRNEPDWQGEIR
jgi:phosphatidylserine decarboxylase